MNKLLKIGFVPCIMLFALFGVALGGQDSTAFTPQDNSSIIGIAFLCIIGLGIYLLPSIISFIRGNSYSVIILLVNIFFAWTLVVWVILLIYTVFPKNKSLISPIISPTGKQTMGEHVGNTMKEAKAIARDDNDIYSELEKVARLKESGAITEEEFLEMKKRIMTK